MHFELRERGLSVQYYRLLLSLASGAVGVQSKFPRQCCRTGRRCPNAALHCWLLLGAVAQAVFEGAIAIVTKKMDFGLNSYVNISKFWHFIVFVYDGALCWNSFELLSINCKIKMYLFLYLFLCCCSCSYIWISTRGLYLLCLQFPFPSCCREGKGRVSKHHVLWNVSVRALNWRMLFLNHSRSSACGILQLWRNRSLQKESKTGNKKQVLDAAGAECVQRCVTRLDFYPSC